MDTEELSSSSSDSDKDYVDYGTHYHSDEEFDKKKLRSSTKVKFSKE